MARPVATPSRAGRSIPTHCPSPYLAIPASVTPSNSSRASCTPTSKQTFLAPKRPLSSDEESLPDTLRVETPQAKSNPRSVSSTAGKNPSSMTAAKARAAPPSSREPSSYASNKSGPATTSCGGSSDEEVHSQSKCSRMYFIVAGEHLMRRMMVRLLMQQPIIAFTAYAARRRMVAVMYQRRCRKRGPLVASSGMISWPSLRIATTRRPGLASSA